MTDPDDIVAIRPNKWIGACFTTEDGKEVCYYFPTYEPLPAGPINQWPPPHWPGPWPGPGPGPGPLQPVVASGPYDNPRPVPWITDLGLIAAAWGLVTAVSDGGAAESMRSTLKSAAEAIAAEGMPDLRLHFPE